MQQIIDRNIEKREEQTYLDIPFSMPPDTARLDIAYAYTRHRVERITEAATRRREVNIIDLMLEDETGQNVGASGSDRREVYLGCAEAASGYAVQPMRAGTWHLRLGAYKVEEDGCPVRVTLTFTPKRRTLYLGDPHVHSVHSDGTFTVSELAHMARKQGLQYLATTDHNTYLQNAYGAADAPVTLIPGMEWTHYRGHCNFLGVANPVRSIIANSDVRMREILEEARANGALVSLNHPMDRSCPWKFALDAPHAAVEVWNGPNWSHNQDAMAWWVRRIGEGERVAAMGGSDFHQIGFGATLGVPTTGIYAPDASAESLVRALAAGHAYIAYAPNGPVLDMTAGAYAMGDIIPKEEKAPLCIQVRRLIAGDEVRLLSAQGVVRTWQSDGYDTLEETLAPPDTRLLRLEVWRTLPMIGRTMAALGNPCYYEA